MDYYLLFESLTESYPAESLWTIGPGEPTEWWVICHHALEVTQRASRGDPTGTVDDQARYWRVAYEVLDIAAEMMVSCEMVTEY